MIGNGLIRRLRKSKLAARLLFGSQFLDLDEGEHYFDVATIGLRPLLAKRIARGARVLDIGTGSAAVIGLWLWRHRQCDVTSSDINPQVIDKARRCIELNHAPIRVHCGSFFAGLDQDFDVAVFNPPYVPTKSGLARGFSEQFRSQWDGGQDGTRVIAAFLQDFAAQQRVPLAILGINSRHLNREQMTELLREHAGLRLDELWRHRWLPVEAYVLARVQPSVSSTTEAAENARGK